MKLLLLLSGLLLGQAAFSQKEVTIRFINDYKDVYHLSLIIYTPDGKIQTRVSNLEPQQQKTYSLPVGTEIYVADWKQEAFAMKGNDIKATGLKPTLVIKEDPLNVDIILSTFKQPGQASKETGK